MTNDHSQPRWTVCFLSLRVKAAAAASGRELNCLVFHTQRSEIHADYALLISNFTPDASLSSPYFVR
ncbi:hypothetical protein E2C01_033278 [Portunus trituberculatus]|uniref:Uncharacterized protein n=1 Tax=Portunus trituberculatus TaxID=210409 RepID=A0A5B7EXF9_PORTR|nr:hypothetical protein [Portunus trituberculatus]